MIYEQNPPKKSSEGKTRIKLENLMYASSSEVEIYDILRFLSVCGDFARIKRKNSFLDNSI